ncbi:aspartic proteinase CDR1-like [Silene latifolia]|uniref:aspartic proteinase CDR1-like n=1 Tax=Silene latifolia TaxID=37657 RepID=UPI003D77C156
MIQSCDSRVCQSLDKSQITCSGKGNCSYSFLYGDFSHTNGDLATDTITFKSGVGANGISFPKISIGCGHNNGGIFESDGSGIVGLGAGPLSLVSQLGSSISGRFSYCLIPYSKEGNYTSKINFGNIGQVTGPGVISTAIVKGQLRTYYYLTLNGLTIEKTTIPFHRKSSSNADDTTMKGNLIIDSGTTLTILPPDMVSDLKTALEKGIQGEKVNDPSGNRLQPCYKTTKGGADLNIPDVTMHFDGGDLVLKPKNTFFGVADGVVCLAISSVSGMLGDGILDYVYRLG